MHPKGNHGQSQKPVHIFLLYFVLFKALLLLLTGMVTSMRELRARPQTFLDCTSSYFSPYKPVQQAMQKCNGAVQTLVPTAAIQEQADPPGQLWRFHLAYAKESLTILFYEGWWQSGSLCSPIPTRARSTACAKQIVGGVGIQSTA